MADSLAIDLREVRKVYRGRVYALDGVEMRVRRGEVFGLLGPNGAGKSTLVKIMMSVVEPTRVRGTILDAPIGHRPTLARVGYLPESHRFPRYLSGRQALEFFGALSKVDRRTRRRRADELLSTVGMSEWGDRRIVTYSKGMMQRVGLAQALMADPDLIVLDEPTDGVDPVGRRDIRNVLSDLRAAGKTVFVNSHLLSELEMICDRVAILFQGRIVRQGTIDELSSAKQRFEIDVADPASDVVETQRRLVRLVLPTVQNSTLPLIRGTMPSGQWVEIEGSTLRIGTSDAAEIQPTLDALRADGLIVRRVQLMRPSLEDLFLEAVAHRSGPPIPAGFVPRPAEGPFVPGVSA